jgi:Spy/CpxP family protein refolding chaperone
MDENYKRYGITAVVILVFAALAWNWFDAGQYSDDPAVAELERLRDANVGKELSPEEEQAQRQDMGKLMSGLTPEQRMSFFESSMPIFIPMMAKRFEADYDKMMAMTPEEQKKEMDKRIDEMEARGGGPPGGGPGGGGGRPQMDPKKMDEFRKKMLGWTTPEQRSKFENGMKMFNERRKERGLQPLPPFGGGGF